MFISFLEVLVTRDVDRLSISKSRTTGQRENEGEKIIFVVSLCTRTSFAQISFTRVFACW